MNPRIAIRRCRAAEIPQLTRLIEQSLAQLGAQDYTPRQLKSAVQHAVGVDSQMVGDGTYYVATVKGIIAGCGGWSRRPSLYGCDKMSETEVRGTSAILDPRRDAAKIRAMYVHPDFARRGIGKQLLKHSESAARRAGYGRLELMATRTGAKLYQKAGYRPAEEIDLQLPDGVVFPVTRMTKLA